MSSTSLEGRLADLHLEKKQTKLYFDFLSAPSRACLIFARLNNLPVTEVAMRIFSGHNKTDEYLTVNPIGLLPFLQHKDLGLPESASILKYMAKNFEDIVDVHWYPKGIKQQAALDSLLHWHHLSLRLGASSLVGAYTKALKFQTIPNEHETSCLKEILNKTLETLENYYLKDSTFCSIPSTKADIGTKPSIADLLIACELEQLMVLWRFSIMDPQLNNYPDFSKYPKIIGYLSNIGRYCAPHYGAVHKTIRKMANRQKARL